VPPTSRLQQQKKLFTRHIFLIPTKKIKFCDQFTAISTSWLNA
jgi:hypothetical protein